MAKLIYFTPTSLDGFIADESGNLDWAAPDEEGFAFINDLLRPIGLYLYGRKMYETMAIWETPDVIPGLTSAMLNFARIWQAADKIVYSKSLETVSTPKTRLKREFDPQLVRDLKAQLPHDLSVGGPTLAWRSWTSAVLLMEWSIFDITRTPNGGCRSWFGALIALPTKALNFEEQRGHGQHESIQNGVRKRLPALHHQGGEEGSYKGGGACHHPLANGLR